MPNALWEASLEPCWSGTGIPSLFSAVREGAWTPEKVLSRVAEALSDLPGTSKPQRRLAEAALLIWHDQLDEAHGIVQDLSDGTASYLHAIIHRREPDFSNARYWLHRAAPHPARSGFRSALRALGTAVAEEDIARVERSGELDPSALLREAENALRSEGESSALQTIQAAELLAVLHSIGTTG